MLLPGLAVVPSSSSWIVKEDGVSLSWLSALSNSQLNSQGAISVPHLHSYLLYGFLDLAQWCLLLLGRLPFQSILHVTSSFSVTYIG